MKNPFKITHGGIGEARQKLGRRNFILMSIVALMMLSVGTVVAVETDANIENIGYSLTAGVGFAWITDDDKFKKLDADGVAALSEDEMKQYSKALNQWNESKEDELRKELDSLKDAGGDNTKAIEKINSQLKEILEANVKQLRKSMKEMGVVIEGLETSTASMKTIEQAVHDHIEKNATKLKAIKAAGSGFIEFKIVGPLETTSATNPDGIPELVGTQVAPASDVNLKPTIIDELVSKFQTGLAAYPYTESIPKDGDYEFVGEKEIKPQIDFKIETRYAEPKKVAAHEILTDESVKDIKGMQSIATNFLRKKHDLKRQRGILFGDGTGDNLKGATLFGRAFVAGGMALKVTTPNFMDVVNACITDIYTTHNYQDETPYMANLVMVNPIDFYIELVSAKDANGLPLYPQAGLFNKVTIGGVTIIPFEDIVAGEIFVCDLKKYNVSDYVSYMVKIGFINDQLITNMFTIVGESRLHGYVKKLDEQAFIKDDIATVRAAIKKP